MLMLHSTKQSIYCVFLKSTKQIAPHTKHRKDFLFTPLLTIINPYHIDIKDSHPSQAITHKKEFRRVRTPIYCGNKRAAVEKNIVTLQVYN